MDVITTKAYTMMMLYGILWVLVWPSIVAAGQFYNESLHLKPLPRNSLLATFQFEVESLPKTITYIDDSKPQHDLSLNTNHYTFFPRSLGPIIESTNTRQLNLRFTQGWWDSKSWGKLPLNGLKSGGTGVEMWAVIEAPDYRSAQESWLKLAESLSGFFCASLNFIDDKITTTPKYKTELDDDYYVSNSENNLYLLRAALPSEPICTENLTPFLKLLPVRGQAGISSLLNGHKVFDSLWHSMSIDIDTQCDNSGCKLRMEQSINSVIDITRSLRRSKEGGIPKPTPGDELRCDDDKAHDIWQCFPLTDPTDLSWSLLSIYGKTIRGPAFIDDPQSTLVHIDVDSNFWDVQVKKANGEILESSSIVQYQSPPRVSQYITGDYDFDFEFSSTNSTKTLPIETPPLYVSRSLTGYSQDQGGFRVLFKNPSSENSVDFVYYESLPWFIRLYLHTLTLKGNGTIKERYYKPATDRKRPSHLEFLINVPPGGSLSLTYQFDKSLLLYAEYPPDANHGFSIEPAVISILNESQENVYQLRTTSLLLNLPTPDFSMPYNVIILTCTIMSLAFGSVFNLLTKKVITEEELEKLAGDSKIARVVSKLKSKISYFKAKFIGA